MNLCNKIKICGLSRPEDIDAANELKPDYIGFVFAPSRRQVSTKEAAALRARLSSGIQAVGVFVNSGEKEILALAGQGLLDMIQLHGDEDPDFINRIKSESRLPVVKAVRVKDAGEILRADRLPCDYLLLDTYAADQYGGSGRCFDWSLIPPLSHPFFLAGGLGIHNLEEAMRTGAFCLDLSSAVETDGKKDPAKMKAVVDLIRHPHIATKQ